MSPSSKSQARCLMPHQHWRMCQLTMSQSPVQVTWSSKILEKRIMSPSQLMLNLLEGSVSFGFTPQAARDLQAEIALLMQSIKAASSSGGKANPQKPMEYRYTGDVFLEIFCNPNIWPSPFAAKVLITIRDERIRLTTEAELTRLIEDVNQYMEQMN